MLFEDNKFKIYTSEEVDLMSALEIDDLNLHVYEELQFFITHKNG